MSLLELAAKRVTEEGLQYKGKDRLILDALKLRPVVTNFHYVNDERRDGKYWRGCRIELDNWEVVELFGESGYVVYRGIYGEKF